MLGLAMTFSGAALSVAALAPFVNVTSTVDVVAIGVSLGSTMVTVVALTHKGDVATLPPTLAVKPFMKFVPITEIVLKRYADVGDTDVMVGSAVTLSGVPVTVTAMAPFGNVSSTDEAATGVPDAITMVTVVALTQASVVAGVPELGVAPTLAVKANPFMKFEPITEMVLPMYADVGDTDVMVGFAVTLSGVPVNVRLISITVLAPIGVPDPMTKITFVSLVRVQDAARVQELGGLPT
jgi:hypothetical protein